MRSISLLCLTISIIIISVKRSTLRQDYILQYITVYIKMRRPAVGNYVSVNPLWYSISKFFIAIALSVISLAIFGYYRN